MNIVLRRIVHFMIGWFSLALIGLLTYALLRALAAIIYLGAPFFDWQWYIPAIVVVVSVPLCILQRWLQPQAKRAGRRTAVVFAFLLVWIVLGFNGFGQSIQLQPNAAPSVPISFWAFSDFRRTPDSVLKDLHAAGGLIYLSIGDVSDIEDAQALVAAMRRLADHGIEFYLAPSLSNFLSVPVYSEWITRIQQIASLVQRERLTTVRGLIGDAESPMNMPYDWLGADRLNFDRAVVEMRESLDDLHRQFPDLQIGVTAMWPQFVDVLDHDADLAMLMRSPVNPPGNWDFVNLMTYSSYYPSDWRGYYVYVHELGMARLYPVSQRSHLIGLIGAGFPGEPLLDFDDLVRDARLSRAMGVQAIAIFQLTDALRVFGEDFVGRVTRAINASDVEATMTVAFSRPVSLIFFGTVMLDALLDARGSQAELWIGWLFASSGVVWQWSRK